MPHSRTPYTLPLKYEPMGAVILNTEGRNVLDVRGWGQLTGNTCHLPPAEAEKIQDAFGERVVASVNLVAELAKEPCGTRGNDYAGSCVKCAPCRARRAAGSSSDREKGGSGNA